MTSQDFIYRLDNASAILAEDLDMISECIHRLSHISDPKEFISCIDAVMNQAECMKVQAEYVKALGLILKNKVGIEG